MGLHVYKYDSDGIVAENLAEAINIFNEDLEYGWFNEGIDPLDVQCFPDTKLISMGECDYDREKWKTKTAGEWAQEFGKGPLFGDYC